MTSSEVEQLDHLLFKTNWNRVYCESGVYLINNAKRKGYVDMTEEYMKKLQKHMQEHFEAMIQICDNAGLTVRVERVPEAIGSPKCKSVVDVRPKRGEYFKEN